MGKILVIIISWPSKTAPYLTHLYFKLNEILGEEIDFFVFKKGDKTNAEGLISHSKLKDFYAKIQERFLFSFNLLTYFMPLLYITGHARISINIVKQHLRKGYSIKSSIGQLFYNYRLIKNEYKLVHVNAMQSLKHFEFEIWFPKAKILASTRGQDFSFNQAEYGEQIKKIHHLHSISQYLCDVAIKAGVPSTKITIIPPAFINTEKPNEITKQSNEDGKTSVATAARLFWIKGYRYALRAISILAKRGIDIHYHIYGSGPQKEEMLYLIKSQGLENYVSLHGWLNESDLKIELLKSRIYLLLSIEEGYNNSVLMAQALGLPCVVARTGGLPENVIHNRTGLVVNPYDPQNAADALHYLITNPDIYFNLRSQAIERVKELSIENQANSFSQLYSQLLEQK